MARLTEQKEALLNKAIDELKLNTGLSYPTNGLLEFAEKLDIDVVEAELPPFEGHKVKGLVKHADKKIYLNADQFGTTKTFTLAHELGHFLLHKDKDNFRIDLVDYSVKSDPRNEETEANYFAGALLMPEDKLLYALNHSDNLEEVANAFGVSVPAVESRMKWLNIVKVNG